MALRRELRVIRQRGWGTQNEELALGLRSIAAPITDKERNAVGAVNIAVQASRWDLAKMEAQLLAPLLAACQSVSAGLSR